MWKNNNGQNMRREDRIRPKLLHTHQILSPGQYHEIARKLTENNISNEILFQILKKLIIHHVYQKKNNSDDELTIYTALCKLYCFGIPFSFFSLLTKNLYLLIISMYRSDELRKLVSLRMFITQLTLMLQTCSLETEHGRNVLCLLSQVTALSPNIATYCFDQLPIYFIFDVILNSKNNSLHASNILANIILHTDREYPLDQFLMFIDKLIQMKRLNDLPNILLCVQKMVEESTEFEPIMKFLFANKRILYFNELLFSGSKAVINGVLLFLEKLLSFRILFFVNFNRIFELTQYDIDTSILSIKFTAKYIRCFPSKADELCIFGGLLTMISSIILNGSVNEKVEVLDIILNVLSNSSFETQKMILMMPLIGSLLELTSILCVDDIELVFLLFQKMLDVATKLDICDILKNVFSEKSNYEILEAISGRGGSISEISDVFLAFLGIDE